ncbi:MULTISPECIES: nickel/cobalt ABC transporter permease [Romboutsia]|jgi:nickel transport system permease protein|uniref:nickel/cobalt ABC transporter permease n=1 Tax=Romboutsia TaxID=1501226 RepID=UPI0021739BD6|nr:MULTISPECIES: nickel/cobalt ABC transporter permease [Romboutsia]MCI9061657.1 ABC transporter permease subunit [Romboutsia sp.]
MKFFDRFKKDKLGVLSLIVILSVCLAGILAPLIAPHDPTAVDIKSKLLGMSLDYPFGTDQLGRCVFSRLLYGIRTTVFLSLIAMVATIVIGTVLGMIAGLFRGWVDELIMRICDIMLSFPSEVMILAIVGILGSGISNIVIANIIAKWAWYTRMIRSIVIQYVDKNYIKFAKVSGCSNLHIIRKHLIPGTIGEIVVLATLDTGWVILNISALSFLGLGVQAPTPEWGMMLSEAKNIMTIYPQQMLPAGLAILVIVAAFNFLGDSLQEALNPKKSMN